MTVPERFVNSSRTFWPAGYDFENLFCPQASSADKAKKTTTLINKATVVFNPFADISESFGGVVILKQIKFGKLPSKFIFAFRAESASRQKDHRSVVSHCEYFMDGLIYLVHVRSIASRTSRPTAGLD